MNIPNRATIIEVGPRDGLQNEPQFVPTETKTAFIQKLWKAGFQEMEITSFVSPKWVPQMLDAKEIMAAAGSAAGSIVLAPNKKGIEAALDSGARKVAVFIGVSSSFNQKNINKTTEDAMLGLLPQIAELKSKGIFVRACISTAFHCPYEGKIDPLATLALCRRFAEAGVDELSVADTIGRAAPTESYSLFSLLKKELPSVLLTAHFHDTRKMALANIYAALLAGIDRFDSSTGGLGGCPFAPGASGNVATEDVVYMLHEMGIDTGINPDILIEAIAIVKPYVSREITSGFYINKMNQ
ncbi:hydroxymethylglutaryl-CoA lyase [Jeotgalibacillus proteolyticus]|uniref:Hydroxymethylglutaryl-CoA lyase n=1 Tax=Jeotgalibacillus proteolyticus TaxID=2082395 RepID=A0A2S5GEI9_9BACL|nr:hydroxymethylglutaryl-CoA lyase [Jeotgalibacillus proteolyticus]PPA71325.1 hydroxymethylglutaryl-CoA lyase [Jeotgalibacillus proteolyticus]